MSVDVDEFNVRSASDTLLRGMHLAYLDLEADFYPEEPRTPFEQHRAYWRSLVGTHRTDRWWAASESDDVLGVCHMATWQDHKDSGLLTLAVRRDARRRGVGRRLLAAGLDGLEREGRSKLIIDTPDGSPLEPALERLGLKKVLGEKISRLFVKDVDWDLMDEWIERAGERAADYDLLYLQPPIPDDHVAAWCRICEAMNTAPLEDLDLEDETMTPDKWRSIEASLETRGDQMRACVAVHRDSGDFAGMTTLHAQTHDPEIANQGDTVVDPAHRNRGLGRLIKASNIKRFVAEFPVAERIYTGNAGSNEAMLNINVAMGFRPILAINAWQGDIADARTALSQ